MGESSKKNFLDRPDIDDFGPPADEDDPKIDDEFDAVPQELEVADEDDELNPNNQGVEELGLLSDDEGLQGEDEIRLM
jgi:hypothetical protein